MTAFNTKKEALTFVNERKKGFRQLIKEDNSRKEFLNKAIKSVKIKKVMRSNWKKPLYVVEGM